MAPWSEGLRGAGEGCRSLSRATSRPLQFAGSPLPSPALQEPAFLRSRRACACVTPPEGPSLPSLMG